MLLMHSLQQKKYTDTKLALLILSGITIISTVSFVSNHLMLIHVGETLSLKKILEISFYYFTPVITWSIIVLLMIRYIRLKIHQIAPLKLFINLTFIGIISSPIIRSTDILIDFSIKYLLDMVSISPFSILADVWIVVFASVYQSAILFIVTSALLIWYFHSTSKQQINKLTIKDGLNSFVLNLADIQFIKSESNYVEIICLNNKYRTRSTLRSFKQKLNNDFLQIHRSVIINKNNVYQWQHWRNGEYLIKMRNNQHVTSSRTYKSKIEEISQHFIPG